MSNGIQRAGGNGRRSTCVVYGGLLYTSGITTVDLQADMKNQAGDVLSQLDKLMSRHGTNKKNILCATIYLTSMAEIADFNATWDEWINDSCEPARTVVEAKLALDEYRLKVSLIVAVTK